MTDIQVSGLTDRQPAECITDRDPEIPVLYISAHSRDVIQHLPRTNSPWISKPFEPDTLVQKVRELLEKEKPHERREIL